MTDIPSTTTSVPSRLGVTARHEDGRLTLELRPSPATLVLGSYRASVISYVVDAVAGITVDGGADVWTFTTDLSVRMRPVPAAELVLATAEVAREGRRSVTCTVDLFDAADGAPVGVGAVGFARVPRRDGDPPKPMVAPADAPALFADLRTLDRPLRSEAGIDVVDAAGGVVEVAVRPELCNPAGTLQGAMVALIAEAAAEELATARAGAPMLVVDLDVRYLGKATAGTVRTRSRLLGDRPDAPVEVELVASTTGEVTTLVYARAVSPG